ncbi:MAG: metallophosphoesterase [Erysipelotrichaceae bacterium]|nr:metallophosphoesterase [Erysipelotrichaceae bacterium]MDY5252806.1 metallophosphoesterase [Erysipelotrichaceae bacterium]
MTTFICSCCLFVLISFYYYGFNRLLCNDKLTNVVISLILALTAFKLSSWLFLLVVYFMIISLLLLGLSRMIKLSLGKIMIIAFSVSLIINGYGYLNMRDIVFTKYDISNQHGKTLALISDLHYPVSMDLARLENLVYDINEQAVDMVILAGDIVDENTSYEDMVACFKVLGELAGPKYMIYGNHETINYRFKKAYTLEDIAKNLTLNGIYLLDDELIKIDDILLYGKHEKEPLPFAKEDYVIMVDHEPNDLKQASKDNVDLHLSGHVHGGQLFPVKWLYDSLHLFDNSYGLKYFGDMISINTSGVAGWGFPCKSQGKAEVVLIKL